MIKLESNIVDIRRNLIGFVVSGKEKELGGFSSDVIKRPMPIDQLIKANFCNNQILVKDNKIIERNNFKLNSLPMLIYDGKDYINIPNHMTIKERYVSDNENIGFKVVFGDGSEEAFRYEVIITLSTWFLPSNFVIRTSAKGKKYIASKNGYPKLDDLPSHLIGEESKAKRTKSAAKEAKTGISGEVQSGFDILDIYGFVDECGGCIIHLPSEKYVAATEGGHVELEEFKSLNIGEIASTKIKFSGTKLNANGDFKKVGVVKVNFGKVSNNITTFVYRNKSIFLNGENYIKNFGIAVPASSVDELLKKLGKSLALDEITDPKVISPLSLVIDCDELKFYKVNTNKIDLLSEDKRKNSIMSAKELVNLCKKMYSLKLISKAMGPKGGLLKELNNELSESEINKAKKREVHNMFKMMTPEALSVLQSKNIDIYTGAYTETGKPFIKASGSGRGESEEISVEYVLNGFDPAKLTGGKVLEAVKTNNTSVLPNTVINKVKAVLDLDDPLKRYRAAEKLYRKSEDSINELNKKLWLHLSAMYLNGNKTSIHSHDRQKWEVDTGSKVKAAKVYKCTESGAEGLIVKIKGLAI